MTTTPHNHRSMTLKNLNRMHESFWANQTNLTWLRIAEPDLVGFALRRVHSDALHRVSLANQPSFEELLELAAETKAKLVKSHRTALSRKGGSASKRDALAKLILEMVHRNPEMTEPQLLGRLKQAAQGQIVIEIDREKVSFWDRNREKSSPISGLKDRLARAKKQIRG